MAALLISIFLLCFVGCAVSKLDTSLCTIEEQSNGLIPPPLPTNFELKAEFVDDLGNLTAYEEIYFDYANERAKYKYLLDSLEYNYLFDYETSQVVEWIKVHPGRSVKRDPLSQRCEAISMDEHQYKSLFGYQYAGARPARMFNSFQVMRYGGQYLYSADGALKLDERNMKVNKFKGCLYDPSMKATIKSDYYFADTDAVTPASGPPSDVTGSVPVKFYWDGRFDDGKNFSWTVSISWFKGEPNFEPETFQIPPWIHCNNYLGRKPIPKLPKAFSTRLMVTTYQMDFLGQLQEETSYESFEEIYYDFDKKLARRDFTPNKNADPEIKDAFGNYAPVSTIYDFNEGIRFTINKPSGRCYVKSIAKNEYFDTDNDDKIYALLAKPEQIFLMQMDDMEYKGTAVARGIDCDVWNGQHFHSTYNASFVKETYFSTNGWHVIEDEVEQYRVPVKNVLIRKEINEEAVEGITTYDFLKFKSKPPKLASFDIKNCVELINHKRFAIELYVDDSNRDLIFKYKFLLAEAAQLYIANKTGVISPVRVQRVRLFQSRNTKKVFLVFALLDKAPMKVSDDGQRGLVLEDAIPLLQRLVETGGFIVQFKDPNTDSNIAVSAVRGGLYIMTGDGNLTPAPLYPAKLQEEEPKKDKENIAKKTEGEIHHGMTKGHLTLLAFAMLFIGVGIGIAVMYLYIRMYAERRVEDRIGMDTRAGPSGL